jgi:hypothetical protein
VKKRRRDGEKRDVDHARRSNDDEGGRSFRYAQQDEHGREPNERTRCAENECVVHPVTFSPRTAIAAR